MRASSRSCRSPVGKWLTPFQITAQAAGAIVYLGVAVSVAGLLLWLYPLCVVAARIAVSVQYLQPVVGIAAASFLFGDRLGMMFVVGMNLILCGLGLAAANKRVSSNEAAFRK